MVKTNRKFWIHLILFAAVVLAVDTAYVSEGLAVAFVLLIFLVVMLGLFILKDDTIQNIKTFCIKALIGFTLIFSLLSMLALLVYVLAEVLKYR